MAYEWKDSYDWLYEGWSIRGTIGICIVRDILLKALVLSSISIDLIIRTISMEGQEHYIRQLRISKAMMSGR